MIEALSPSNYIAAISDPYYRGIMVTTLGVAFLFNSLRSRSGFRPHIPSRA